MPRPHAIMQLGQAGFTLVELLVVMGIFAVTAGMVTVNLVNPQTTAQISSTVDEIIVDLKSQQLKAMMGDSGTGATAQPHGIYIEANRYTLFKGSAYSGSDTDNVVVDTKDGISLSTSFTSSQIIFSKGTGDFANFATNNNDVTIQNSISGSSKQITVNRLGVVTVN